MRKILFTLSLGVLLIPTWASNPIGSDTCANYVNLIKNGNFQSGLTHYASPLSQASRSSANCAGTNLDGLGVDNIFNAFCTAFPATQLRQAEPILIVDINLLPSPVGFLSQNIVGILPGEKHTLSFESTIRFSNHPITMEVYYDGQLVQSFLMQNSTSFSYHEFEWYAPANAPTSGVLEFVLPNATMFSDFALGDLRLMTCQSIDFSTNKFYQENFRVYPNPFSERIEIESSTPFTNWKLINTEGKVCMISSEKQADLSHFPKGIYLLEVHFSDGRIERKKLVK